MIIRLLKKLNHKDSKHRVAIRKLIAKHKANKLHNDILTGKAPRGRTAQ
jgi:hypothetical protein